MDEAMVTSLCFSPTLADESCCLTVTSLPNGAGPNDDTTGSDDSRLAPEDRLVSA